MEDNLITIILSHSNSLLFSSLRYILSSGKLYLTYFNIYIMSNIKVISERIASLSFAFAHKHDITLIPIDIIVGEETYKDDNDKKAQKFLEEMTTFDHIPSTAVPSHGEMLKIVREAMKNTDQAIYIAASSKLSSIHDRGLAVAKDLKKEGKDLRVFDSGAVVSVEGLYVYEAQELVNQGKSLDEIEKQLIRWRDEERFDEFGVINTLKYLEKNGRIGKAQAWLGNIFHFKPIVSIKDGELEPLAKVRTDQQALELIIEKIKNDMEKFKTNKLKIMYDYGVSSLFLKTIVAKRIEKDFDAEIVSFNKISTGIACHLGPEVWGIAVKYE